MTEPRGVCKCGKALSRVLDISSQSKLKHWRKRRNKILKTYPKIRKIILRYVTEMISLMSRTEQKNCAISTSYLAGLFDIFILLHI